MTTWQIAWDDHVWVEADVTVGHLAAFVAVNGADDWNALDPFAGPGKLMGIVSVFLSQAKGISVDDALTEISRAPALKLLNALSQIPDPPESDEVIPAEVAPRTKPRPTRRTQPARQK